MTGRSVCCRVRQEAAEEGWRGEGWRLSVVGETCKGSDFQPPPQALGAGPWLRLVDPVRSIHFYSCFTDEKNRGSAGLCGAEITQVVRGGRSAPQCSGLSSHPPPPGSPRPQHPRGPHTPALCHPTVPLRGQPLLRLRSLKRVSQGPLAFSSAPALKGAGGQSGGLQGHPASLEQHAEALMDKEVTQGMAPGGGTSFSS